MARTVGIPHGLLFYRYYPMWKAFFEALGYEGMVVQPGRIGFRAEPSAVARANLRRGRGDRRGAWRLAIAWLEQVAAERGVERRDAVEEGGAGRGRGDLDEGIGSNRRVFINDRIAEVLNEYTLEDLLDPSWLLQQDVPVGDNVVRPASFSEPEGSERDSKGGPRNRLRRSRETSATQD